MDNVNRIDIVTWPNGKHDFRILATENGNILCSSHQGYENKAEAVDMAKRVTTAPTDAHITFSQE